MRAYIAGLAHAAPSPTRTAVLAPQSVLDTVEDVEVGTQCVVLKDGVDEARMSRQFSGVKTRVDAKGGRNVDTSRTRDVAALPEPFDRHRQLCPGNRDNAHEQGTRGPSVNGSRSARVWRLTGAHGVIDKAAHVVARGRPQ